MRVVVTGGTGFVGAALIDALIDHEIISIGRSRTRSAHQHYAYQLENAVDLGGALEKCEVVIHTAARVHVFNDEADGALEEFRKVNVKGTLNLARQAAVAGVKRFIFISSIKVNGEQTSFEKPFTSDDIPSPQDYYGLSKKEAEQGLRELALETGMEVVIIRPPLVYGMGVKGNFASLMKLVRTGVPLPFGAISNKRSMVALDNLIDLIVTCIDHPNAGNEVFLVCDGEDLSTTELLRGLAKAMERRSFLFPVQVAFLGFLARMVGKKEVCKRLFGSLQIDMSKTNAVLGWQPPVSVKEGLRRCFVSESST